MSILESLELALKNIVSSKTRTVLTMLGIIIGVAAVIVIVGLGNGLEGYITDSFSDMGTDTLTVTVMSRGSTRSMSVDDMYELVEENSQYLNLCSPTVAMMGFVKIGTETVSSTSCLGVSEDYLTIKHFNVAQGRDLQYSDIALRSKVCVIGAYLNQAYFGGNALGQTLRVGGQTLTVVGGDGAAGILHGRGRDRRLPVPALLHRLPHLRRGEQLRHHHAGRGPAQ